MPDNLEKRSNSDAPSHLTWISQIPDIVWAPVTVGSLTLMVGLFGLVADQPWLFPSLGPSAFLQVEKPQQATSRFYNVVVGHLHGVAAGLFAVLLLEADRAPALISTEEVTLVRVVAAVLAATLSMLLGFVLKASHPPAAATALLFALGSYEPTIQDVMTVVAGVLMFAIAGEFLRQLRLKAKSLKS